MNLVLIGQRGSGKRTVGRLLADALWMQFVDVEERAAAQVGGSPDAAARARIEGEIVVRLAGEDNRVIRLSGGANAAGQAKVLKAKGKVIWLAADPAVLAERLGRAAAPAEPVEDIRRRLDEQAPGYQAAADLRIDTTYLTPQQTVQQIVKRI